MNSEFDTLRSSVSKSLLAFVFLVAAALPASTEPLRSTGTVDVFFSPSGGATETVVQELN